jgi:arsenate reductase
MNKKVLIMCTGNSCRSIIAEALINKKLQNIEAYSCGIAPSGKVNPNAKKVLEENKIWSDKYYSKHLNELLNIDFDLVITVCNHAQESCPIFPKTTKNIHIGFEDPNGKAYEAFEITYHEIKESLLPKVIEALKISKTLNS